MKPIIGIVAKPLSDFECPDDIWVEDSVKDEFRDIVYSGDCLAIGVLPPFQSPKFNRDESDCALPNNLTEKEKEDLNTILEKCDGFVLQGGLSDDYYEFYIAEYALENNIPIIGICAGFNTLAIATGSNIVSGNTLGIDEKLHNVYDKDFRHHIDVAKGTILYDAFHTESMFVNSLHKRFLSKSYLDTNPSRVEVNATVTDILKNGSRCTTVEAFTVQDVTFAMGVKWHPEVMEEEHKRKLFERFLTACKGGNQ